MTERGWYPRARPARPVSRAKNVGVTLVALIAAFGLMTLFRPDQVSSIAEMFGIAKPHRLLFVVGPKVGSSHYSILGTDAAGDPITYDPCRSVHYVINPSGAPADYLDFIDPAIDKAQSASGLKFVYDGLSRDTWSEHTHATKDEPVLLSFPSSLDSKADADAVGLGGSAFLKSTHPGHSHYATGQIALLRSWFRKQSARHKTAAEQSVVMHELGHVIGLGHVRDRQQVMYPKSHGQTEYGNGDLAGLAKLGSGPCE